MGNFYFFKICSYGFRFFCNSTYSSFYTLKLFFKTSGENEIINAKIFSSTKIDDGFKSIYFLFSFFFFFGEEGKEK